MNVRKLVILITAVSLGCRDRSLAEADPLDANTTGLGAANIGVGVAHDPAWVELVGGEGDDEAWAVSVGAGVVVAGITRSPWFGDLRDPCVASGDDAGKDCGDAFALDLESGDGIQFGGPNQDIVRGVWHDAEGVYLGGTSNEPNFRKDAWVMQVARDFSKRGWEVLIEHANKVDEVLSLAAVGSTIHVAGGSAGSVGANQPAGDEDMFVLAVSSDGETGSSSQWGTARFEEVMGLAADTAGVYAAGQTGGWLGDAVGGASFGGTDVVLRVMQPDLTPVCTLQFGTLGNDVGQAIAVVGEHLYVAGWTTGVINADEADGGRCNQDPSSASLDAFVAKYDKSCRHIWTRQFGSPSGDTIDAIAADDDRVYVVGTTGGAAHHSEQPDSTDAFLRAYDVDGALVGEVLFDSSDGVSRADSGRAVAVDGDLVYVAGATDGALGAGAHGGTDAFIASVPIEVASSGVVAEGDGCDGE
jgi:hypothetical protein